MREFAEISGENPEEQPLILKTKLVNSLEVNSHELDRICSHCKS